MGKQLMQVLIAWDQLLNTLAGTLLYLFTQRLHWADETFSAMTYRMGWKVMQRFIDSLFFWQTAHCQESYEAEQERLQLAPEYRRQ